MRNSPLGRGGGQTPLPVREMGIGMHCPAGSGHSSTSTSPTAVPTAAVAAITAATTTIVSTTHAGANSMIPRATLAKATHIAAQATRPSPAGGTRVVPNLRLQLLHLPAGERRAHLQEQ